MAMYYGQPLTEEERQRRALEERLGFVPPESVDLDRFMGPPAPAAPAPLSPGQAPMPAAADPTPAAIPPPREAPPLPDQSLPEPPEAEGVTAGQRVAQVLALLSDLASVKSRVEGKRSGTLASESVGRLIEGDVRQRQQRADQVWNQQTQNRLSNRRLGIAETQEQRAQESYDQATKPGSQLATLIQEDLRRRRDAGQIQMTDEQIAAITPETYDRLGLGSEARAGHGVQLNEQQADAARERRAVDAEEMLKIAKESGYETPNVDPTNPEAVKMWWSGVQQDKRLSAMLMRAALVKKNKGKGRGARAFLPTSALVQMSNEGKESQVAEYADLLEEELSRTTEPQDRMVYAMQLEQARNVQARKIAGMVYTGSVPPTEKQYNEAYKAKKARDEFIAKTNRGLELLEQIGSGTFDLMQARNPLSDKYDLMEQLRTVQEQREAIGRQIYGFGAPQAHEQIPIKKAVGDLTDFVGQSTGAAQAVANENIQITTGMANNYLESLHYRDAPSDPQGAAPVSEMSDDEFQRQLEAERERNRMLRGGR